MINYSIVIPHKNTPELLQYCLDSIPVRDDVQVIVVDDNSDTDKVDFNHFPKWDGLFYECYFTKEGKGAGYARNIGLEHANGKWVLFADSDDYFLPKIDWVFDKLVDSEEDVVFFRPKGVMIQDKMLPSKRGNAINRIIDRYFETSNEFELRCWVYSPWCKFIKKSLIISNNIRFEETQYSNDILFSVWTGIKARAIKVIDEKLYCLTESNDSLTSNFNKKPGELLLRAEVFFKAQRIIYEHGYLVWEEEVMYYLRRLFDENKRAFFEHFNQMRKMGYEKGRLVSALFKNHSQKSFLKRALYIYVMTVFNPKW